jgi:regulator of nucleoside diphosphate kinase
MNVVSSAVIRVINELDHVRIAKLLESANAAHADLQDLLDNADLVAPSEMAPDVVTMRSRVRVAETNGSDPREIVLSYPDEADAAQGHVSVLSPAGTALLGLKAGDVAGWVMPGGRSSSVRIEAVLFQPEASGELLR